VPSPILANIYLHELDCLMEKLIAKFNSGKARRLTSEYSSISQKGRRLNKKIEQEINPEYRECLIEQKKVMQRRMLEIPSGDQYDPDYRRLRYCRYADDFVLGAICSKEEAEGIYREIETFLSSELKLKTSQAKSGIKHNTEVIRFLGYDITIRNTEKIVSVRTKDQQHYKKRSFKGKISLTVPKAKMKGFAEKKEHGNWEMMEAAHRPILAHISDAEIASLYSAEMRGFAEYYALADNFSSLNRLRFLWIQSFLKTMGNKYKTSMQKVATMLNRGNCDSVG
jgi:RNA-directed DNA polymerase